MNFPKIIQKIPTENQILFMESDINYTIIHLSNGNKLVSGYSLAFYEKRINNQCFLRINRSFMINKSFIRKINFDENTAFVVLENDENIVVSRRKLKVLRVQHPVLFEIQSI